MENCTSRSVTESSPVFHCLFVWLLRGEQQEFGVFPKDFSIFQCFPYFPVHFYAVPLVQLFFKRLSSLHWLQMRSYSPPIFHVSVPKVCKTVRIDQCGRGGKTSLRDKGVGWLPGNTVFGTWGSCIWAFPVTERACSKPGQIPIWREEMGVNFHSLP